MTSELSRTQLAPTPSANSRMKPNASHSRILGRLGRPQTLTLDSDATPMPLNDPAPSSGAGDAKIERSPGHNAFIGPQGIRAGWRLLLFLLFFIAIANGIGFGMRHVPAIRAWHKAQNPAVMAAPTQIFDEGVAVLSLLLAALLMAAIEKRNFSDYYLPPNQTLGKRFWQGVPYGFAMLSLLLALIAAFHGFSLGNMALSRSDAVKSGLLYAIGFTLVALFEEFSFRGYMQSTLTSGIGFWPAAILLSILFGAVHLQNLNEAPVGALMAGSFGLLAAFSLRRTGNIWFPIGMHAAWDWGETYFYSTPDSGFLAQGHLFNSSFHGSSWLTGGPVGPEGSAFALAVLVVGAVGIHFLFPEKNQIS
jgi:CAAX protease family protein